VVCGEDPVKQIRPGHDLSFTLTRRLFWNLSSLGLEAVWSTPLLEALVGGQ